MLFMCVVCVQGNARLNAASAKWHSRPTATCIATCASTRKNLRVHPQQTQRVPTPPQPPPGHTAPVAGNDPSLGPMESLVDGHGACLMMWRDRNGSWRLVLLRRRAVMERWICAKTKQKRVWMNLSVLPHQTRLANYLSVTFLLPRWFVHSAFGRTRRLLYACSMLLAHFNLCALRNSDILILIDILCKW